MIGVIDSGAGNLFSVGRALNSLALDFSPVRKPADCLRVDRLLLPGVGHYGAAVRQLVSSGLWTALQGWVAADRPLLGICLGMQLLFSWSEEGGEGLPGLGLMPGVVAALPGPKRLHVGWNSLRVCRPSPLLEGLATGEYVYFVHGYVARPDSLSGVVAESDFQGAFPAVVGRGRTWGVQFHPEKSGAAGLRILANWGTRC